MDKRIDEAVGLGVMAGYLTAFAGAVLMFFS